MGKEIIKFGVGLKNLNFIVIKIVLFLNDVIINTSLVT